MCEIRKLKFFHFFANKFTEYVVGYPNGVLCCSAMPLYPFYVAATRAHETRGLAPQSSCSPFRAFADPALEFAFLSGL